ncbi:hypothetical protein H5410_061584 [Solanum commersonii]|uniref:Uncharacterized protein n=1 Tax=Solanum commersonii TaxID=4109 RepID=A0A9J5W8F7_SOLCO|nr:hypothetical protein H5410_061584 [Solanum commersonii]
MQLSALLGSEVLAGCFYRDYTANDLSADVHQKGGKSHVIPIRITISHFTIDNFLGYPMGCADAVETDAEEIIDMVGKASLADQQKQVQENVHSQITSFCKYMDHISQPDLMVKDKQGTPSSENNSSPRSSGLSFAIGRTAPLKDHSGKILS